MLDTLIQIFSEPAAWAALVTLIVMEVVLGIDNLIFISILTNKLPKENQAKARRIGIGGALLLRLGLLSVIAFIIGIAIVILFFLMDKLLIFVHPSMAGLVQYLSTEFHLSNISRGVIDTRNLIYFGSVIGFFLFMTTRVIESRKWS